MMEGILFEKDEITIHSSEAEYLTYVASGGDQQDSIEMRYEDENIWLTQKMMPMRGMKNIFDSFIIFTDATGIEINMFCIIFYNAT